jgi:hypothetical protein
MALWPLTRGVLLVVRCCLMSSLCWHLLLMMVITAATVYGAVAADRRSAPRGGSRVDGVGFMV